jgi:hypothetical protein
MLLDEPPVAAKANAHMQRTLNIPTP